MIQAIIFTMTFLCFLYPEYQMLFDILSSLRLPSHNISKQRKRDGCLQESYYYYLVIVDENDLRFEK
jgi:hypothetical protein